MKNNEAQKGGGFFKKIRKQFSGAPKGTMLTVPLEENSEESAHPDIVEEYSAIKQNPDRLTGWDFERAFDFLEKYPESDYVVKLRDEMYGTTSEALKGLSYPSAVKILQQMPDHPGARSIVHGMRKLEADYIRELRSDVIAYMLEVIPDHPLRNELATDLAVKNLTNAYEFVERNPDHPCSRIVIQAMFDRDPNIATLLLHERMDHPMVDSIFKGIYSIPEKAVAKLEPDAIIFIIEVASDHPYADQMLARFVERNYIKAFDFVKNNPDHQLVGRLAELIGRRNPELLPLLKA